MQLRRSAGLMNVRFCGLHIVAIVYIPEEDFFEMKNIIDPYG
jgi:hypothetical protein